jgi:hypothetical protein
METSSLHPSTATPIAGLILDPGREADDTGLAISHTLEYVKVAGESTSRARTILLLLISAAVASFAAYWNLDHTFVQRRVDVMERALDAGPMRVTDPCGNRGARDAARCEELASVWSAVRERVISRSPTLTDAPDSVRNPAFVTALRAQLDTLRGASGRDARTMKLPVFDLTFEAPDLWLFTGLAFALLLVALVYCIACERRDVRQAFVVARELGTESLCFRMLAMRQVLTVPEQPPIPGRVVWQGLTQSLYLFPIAVQGYATFIVWRGRHESVGGVPEVSSGAWILHGVLLASTALLTYVSSRMERDYDDDWRCWTARIRELDQLRSGQCSGNRLLSRSYSPPDSYLRRRRHRLHKCTRFRRAARRFLRNRPPAIS